MTTATVALRRTSLREALSVVAVTAWALAVGAAAVTKPVVGLALGVLPVVLLLLMRPTVAAVLAIGLTPLFRDVIGNEASNVNIDVADLFFYLTVAALIAPVLLNRGIGARFRELRATVAWAIPFSIWLLIVLADHFSQSSVLKTGHTFEVFLLPLVLGAAVLDRRSARWALALFILTSCLLAVGWIVGVHTSWLGQKNPSGQFLVDALLLTLLFVRDWRLRIPTIVVLAVGLMFTASRGALLALALGGVAFLAIRGLGSWRRTVAAVLPLSLAIIVGYNLIPASLQARLAVYSSGSSISSVSTSASGPTSMSAAQYTIKIRKAYRTDGMQLVREHPIFGVGAGNYHTGNPVLGTQTTDPHQMLIRTAADDGVPGLVLFVVLVLGTALSMLRRLGTARWAAAALVLQVATFAHGFVDVYWVRGTPVVGWLLVGMAFNRRLGFERAPVQ